MKCKPFTSIYNFNVFEFNAKKSPKNRSNFVNQIKICLKQSNPHCLKIFEKMKAISLLVCCIAAN